MAKITISDLHSVSSDLVFGSESFLNELTEQEIEDILGGDGEINILGIIKIKWKKSKY